MLANLIKRGGEKKSPSAAALIVPPRDDPITHRRRDGSDPTTNPMPRRDPILNPKLFSPVPTRPFPDPPPPHIVEATAAHVLRLVPPHQPPPTSRCFSLSYCRQLRAASRADDDLNGHVLHRDCLRFGSELQDSSKRRKRSRTGGSSGGWRKEGGGASVFQHICKRSPRSLIKWLWSG